jgi:hypothetical protein
MATHARPLRHEGVAATLRFRIDSDHAESDLDHSCHSP